MLDRPLTTFEWCVISAGGAFSVAILFLAGNGTKMLVGFVLAVILVGFFWAKHRSDHTVDVNVEPAQITFNPTITASPQIDAGSTHNSQATTDNDSQRLQLSDADQPFPYTLPNRAAPKHLDSGGLTEAEYEQMIREEHGPAGEVEPIVEPEDDEDDFPDIFGGGITR